MYHLEWNYIFKGGQSYLFFQKKAFQFSDLSDDMTKVIYNLGTTEHSEKISLGFFTLHVSSQKSGSTACLTQNYPKKSVN